MGLDLPPACVRILRRDVERLGFPGRFSIYDQADAVRLVGYVIRDLNLDPAVPAAIGARHDLDGQERKRRAEPVHRAGRADPRKIGEVYVEYQKACSGRVPWTSTTS